MGDEIELGAVERLFGNAAGKLAMSSTKSAIGHLLGAAGAVEAIFSVLAIRDNIAPPTLNLDNPSVETAIDLVPHKAQEARDQHRAVELVRLRRHQRLADPAPRGVRRRHVERDAGGLTKSLRGRAPLDALRHISRRVRLEL